MKKEITKIIADSLISGEPIIMTNGCSICGSEVCDITENLLEQIYHTAFRKGQIEGHQSGYKDGHLDGFKINAEACIEEGYQAGKREARKKIAANVKKIMYNIINNCEDNETDKSITRSSI